MKPLISESLNAKTSHASIEASWVGQQFDLSTDDGNITLEVGSELKGTSKVFCVSGEINLLVPAEADILMTALADGGSISSDFSMETSDEGLIKSARIKIGDGSNRLVLKTVHGSIKIEEL